MPALLDANKIPPEWRLLAEDREKALAKHNIANMQRYNKHTKLLPSLEIGDHVCVQNQTGPKTHKVGENWCCGGES